MILDKVAKGDGAAVQACIDTYGALVWSLARRLLPDRPVAIAALAAPAAVVIDHIVRFQAAREESEETP